MPSLLRPHHGFAKKLGMVSQKIEKECLLVTLHEPATSRAKPLRCLRRTVAAKALAAYRLLSSSRWVSAVWFLGVMEIRVPRPSNLG